MIPNKPALTTEALFAEAKTFAEYESTHRETTIYRATDGKVVGTYLEMKFRVYLASKYTFVQGNAASGIDFPDLNIDRTRKHHLVAQHHITLNQRKRVAKSCM